MKRSIENHTPTQTTRRLAIVLLLVIGLAATGCDTLDSNAVEDDASASLLQASPGWDQDIQPLGPPAKAPGEDDTYAADAKWADEPALLGPPEEAPRDTAYGVSNAVSGVVTITAILEEGLVQQKPSGKVRVRDRVIALQFDGDLQGTGIFEQNGFFKPNGNGKVYGPYTLKVSWKGRSGIISGQYNGTVKAGYLSGTLKAKGSGGLEGLRLKSTFEGPINGPFIYAGHMLDADANS